MREPERTPRYRKDEAREARLRELNELLAPLQDRLEASLDGPRLPVVFVIGTPRSGSTLLSQVLARSGLAGYVSNFVARFWRAPALGARLEQALGVRDELPARPFESEHGLTRGWSSPHEFGYFWDGWFAAGQTTHNVGPDALARIDAAALRRRVASLEAAYGLPMAFKNNTWCTLQADWLAGCFPTAHFLVCRRDPLYVAQSLLQSRLERLGSEEAWWSMRPSSYDRLLALPPREQVAAQAIELEREMDDALTRVPAERMLEVPYARLCADPRGVLEQIASRLATTASGSGLAAIPERFDATDVQRLPDEAWRELVDAVTRLRGRRDGVPPAAGPRS